MHKIICVPSDLGAPEKGTGNGPIEIIRTIKGLNSLPIEFISIPKENPGHQIGGCIKQKNTPEIIELCSQLASKVAESIKEEHIPFSTLFSEDESMTAYPGR